MTHKLKIFQYGFVALAVFAFAYLMGVNTLIAKAALLVFAPTNCYTAAATTTLSHVATTTLACPMGNDGADSATLAIQVNASSTAAKFKVYVEESMDGVDWYPVPSATSTDELSLQVRPFATFTFASSTIGGTAGLLGASTTYQGYTAENNRNHYEVDVPVRMKRVRAYTVISTGNAGVWMQIIPKINL